MVHSQCLRPSTLSVHLGSTQTGTPGPSEKDESTHQEYTGHVPILDLVGMPASTATNELTCSLSLNHQAGSADSVLVTIISKDPGGWASQSGQGKDRGGQSALVMGPQRLLYSLCTI